MAQNRDRRLIDGVAYWLDAPGINSDSPTMIGVFHRTSSSRPNYWTVPGTADHYTAGIGIDVLRRIPTPKRRTTIDKTIMGGSDGNHGTVLSD